MKILSSIRLPRLPKWLGAPLLGSLAACASAPFPQTVPDYRLNSQLKTTRPLPLSEITLQRRISAGEWLPEKFIRYPLELVESATLESERLKKSHQLDMGLGGASWLLTPFASVAGLGVDFYEMVTFRTPTQANLASVYEDQWFDPQVTLPNLFYPPLPFETPTVPEPDRLLAWRAVSSKTPAGIFYWNGERREMRNANGGYAVATASGLQVTDGESGNPPVKVTLPGRARDILGYDPAYLFAPVPGNRELVAWSNMLDKDPAEACVLGMNACTGNVNWGYRTVGLELDNVNLSAAGDAVIIRSHTLEAPIRTFRHALDSKTGGLLWFETE